MFDVISWLSGFALKFIKTGGYGGIFVLSALESAAIPVPSEVVVPFSGFLASTGTFSLWTVIALVTLANLAGSLVLFWIGSSGGRWVLERYGKYVLVHKRDLDRADQWFYLYGVKAVFWSRMLPVVRTFISLPAGVARMSVSKFVVFTFLGALPWNAALAYIGYKAGENWNILHQYFRKADIIIVLVIVGAIGWYLFKHLSGRNKTGSHSAES